MLVCLLACLLACLMTLLLYNYLRISRFLTHLLTYFLAWLPLMAAADVLTYSFTESTYLILLATLLLFLQELLLAYLLARSVEQASWFPNVFLELYTSENTEDGRDRIWDPSILSRTAMTKTAQLIATTQNGQRGQPASQRAQGSQTGGTWWDQRRDFGISMDRCGF